MFQNFNNRRSASANSILNVTIFGNVTAKIIGKHAQNINGSEIGGLPYSSTQEKILFHKYMITIRKKSFYIGL